MKKFSPHYIGELNFLLTDNLLMKETISIKELMISVLDSSDAKWIKDINDYNIYDNGLWDRNWFTNLFWELYEVLDEEEGRYPYYLVDIITTFTDMDHNIEVKRMIIKRLSDNKLFGMEFEVNRDGYRLYNNSELKPVEAVEVTTTTYNFT